MNKRQIIGVAFIAAMWLVALALAACEAATPTAPAGEVMAAYAATLDAASADLKAQATRQAVATAEALDATQAAMDQAARATSDALALQAQATQQAQEAAARDRAATATAASFDATATMMAFNIEGTAGTAAATATATSDNATATATREAATATTQAALAAAQATAVQATAQHVGRLNQQEQSRQVFSTFGPLALLVIGLAAFGFLVWQLYPVILARLRVIRRKADEGEPVVVMERNGAGGGIEKIVLPLRAFWHLIETGQSPELPSPEMQNKTTARQQVSNVVLAAVGPGSGGARKRSRRGTPRMPRSQNPGPAQLPASTIRVVEPNQVQPWVEDVEAQLVEETDP